MIRDLYAQMAWADAAVWRIVLASDAASDDEKVRDLLWHLHGVQRAFLSIWRNESPHFPAPSTFASVRDLMEWGRAYHAEIDLEAYGDAERIVDLPWSAELTRRFGRPPQDTTLAQTMVQVAMHSTYHRAQVNMRLRELGIEPPLVDFIAWLWIGKPAAEWPASESALASAD